MGLELISRARALDDPVGEDPTDYSGPVAGAPCVISYESLDNKSIGIRARLDTSDADIPEISSITSTLTITLTSIEGDMAKYRISGIASGSSYEADLTIRIEPLDSGSKVIWQADSSLGKLLEILEIGL